MSARGVAARVPFERMLELHGPAVLRFCLVQVGPDRAEDVFQETMLAALRAHDQLRDPAAARSWLFSIAARKAVDSHRAAVRSPLADPESLPTLDAAEVGLGEREIWTAVQQLPTKQREAVALRYLGDLSYREIGTVMETSEEAARRNVFEGLRRLREDLVSR